MTRPGCWGFGACGHGFTLIELLVVISIIALLVAILMPALAKARARAHVMSSLSQVRQLTFSLHSYAQDNAGYLPYSRFWDPGQVASTAQGLYWSNKLLISKYVSTPRIYWSPARQIHGLNLQLIASTPQTTLLAYPGFSANTAGAMPQENLSTGVGTTKPLRPGSGIEPPSAKHVIFSEQYRAVGTLLQDGRDGWWAGFGSTSVTSQKAFCYSGALVRSYMDGHAAARGGDDLRWLYIDDRNGSWFGDGNGEPWYDMNGTDFH